MNNFLKKIIYFSGVPYRLCLESHFFFFFVAPEKSWKLCIICLSLSRIINDQIMEVEAKTLTACNLDQKLVFLEGIEGAIFVVVYASAESAIDNRFLQSLKKNTTFSSSLATCVLDDSHTVET